MDSSVEAAAPPGDGTLFVGSGEGVSATDVLGTRSVEEGPAPEPDALVDDAVFAPRSSTGAPGQEMFAEEVTNVVLDWVADTSVARHRGAEAETVSAARAAQVLAALPSQQSRHRNL